MGSLYLWLLLWISLVQCRNHHRGAGQFWHLTDLHFDPNYSIEGNKEKMCWYSHTNSYRTPDGPFGDYHCDSPWKLVESAVKFMKSTTGETIEFILWTGDSLSHAIEEHSNERKVLATLRNVTDLLKREFPTSFVYAVLGNTDCYPEYQCPPGPSEFYERVAEMWSQWLPLEAMESFRKGGYYTIEQTGRRLRLVALNTVLYSRENRLTNGNGNKDPAGQFAWLEEILEKSRRKKETVYLFGHVPPGTHERYSGGFAFQERFNQRFLNLVHKYHDVIVGQFFGHHHKDSFRIYYDVNHPGQPLSWLFLAPSVTPIGFSRRPEITPNNPAIRLVQFNEENGEVYDYVQFALNLTLANRRGKEMWRVEYNFTHWFNLPNISAINLHNLVMQMAENQHTFDRYYVANTVSWDPPENCDQSCKKLHLCAITRLDYEDFQNCMTATQTLVGSKSSSSSTLHMFSWVLSWIIIHLLNNYIDLR